MFKVGYKKEILNVDWVSEIIIERFDAAFELLTDNAVIYGGAVRDALAGKPLVGDLDISAAPREFENIHQSFIRSARWKQVQKMPGVPQKTDRYGKRKMPINNVVEFEGINGACAQLICSSDHKSSRKEATLHVPRNVDIICCGVIIDINGRVYEVVEGAHDDCLKGILRLNKDMDHPHLESLLQRAAKLEKRGWVNKLDLKEAKRLERKKKPKSARLKKAKSASSAKSKGKIKITGDLSTAEERVVAATPVQTWPEPTDPVPEHYVPGEKRGEWVKGANYGRISSDVIPSEEFRRKYMISDDDEDGSEAKKERLREMYGAKPRKWREM